MTSHIPPAARGPAERGGIIFRLLALLTIVAVLGAIYLLRRPLLRFAGGLLVVEDTLQPSDAIVVLSDDNFHADRAARAAALYRDRWAPRVVASGRSIRPYASIADLMQRDLTERGVPANAIVPLVHAAGNTREEAFAINHLAREQRWRRLLVVTSNYHTRRARYIFRNVVDPSIEVRIVAAPDAGFDPRRWWESRHGLKIYFLELVATAVAVWEVWQADPPPKMSPSRPSEPLPAQP